MSITFYEEIVYIDITKEVFVLQCVISATEKKTCKVFNFSDSAVIY